MAEPTTTAADDLELLRSSAVTAGIIALGYFRREVKSWTKEHDSPVSEADIVLDDYLRVALGRARPDYGWLSEETTDNPDRLERRRTFIVDPIDGTRSFLRGEDSWCVSLAVVEDGAPIAGVIYAPARDEMYEASLGEGASLNGRPILRRRTLDRQSPLIQVTGAVHRELQDAGLVYTRGPYYSSLAYRMSQVATGKLDAAISRRGSHDWDIAAAAIILAEAGLVLEDVCAERLVFNRADVSHGALAAAGEQSLRPVLHQALRRVYGCPPPAEMPADLQRRTP